LARFSIHYRDGRLEEVEADWVERGKGRLLYFLASRVLPDGTRVPRVVSWAWASRVLRGEEVCGRNA
jgi:hypothetical protein